MTRHTSTRAASTVLSIALLTSSLSAQLQWQQVTSSQSPAPRYGHAFTRYGILFGGRDATQAFNDAWVYAGGAQGWLPMPTATAPSPRHGHALDMDLQTILVFGGADANGMRNGETWRFTTNWMNTPPGQAFTSNWSQLNPAHAPSPRDGHALAYDHATSANALLFGGRTDTGLSNETWLFIGGDWQQLSPTQSPPARQGHTLQPTWDGWYLFGGNDDSQTFDDQWFFDGQQWQQLPNMPFAVTGAASAMLGFERSRHVFVGGQDANGSLRTDVYERDLYGNWFAQPVNGNLPPREHAAVIDDFHHLPSFEMVMTAIVFGGVDSQGQVLGDTWRLIPSNISGSQSTGLGCGPGAWSNNGPELFMQRVILGNTRSLSVSTNTHGALAVVGAQLGAATAPLPCEITVTPAVTWFGLSSTSAGQLALPLAIPFFEPLRGQMLSIQGVVFEPTAANGIAISNVLVLRIGD